ncbi:TadE family protein [Pseudomonas sp. NPDC096917]|uniref:TadE family protein n=1 Tax=Pseudomonas sp. NPDC096917 TaxID=3364483 RepID=UPI00383A8448
MNTGLPKKQKGAAAIEFALVFVIFFAVLYGVLSYSFPLLLMQSFNQATAEAVRRSMAVDPSLAADDYKNQVETLAKSVLDTQLGSLPTALTTNVSKTAVYNAGVLTVTVTLPVATLNAILPVLKLPGNITVPSLPPTLSSTSSLQF